MRVLDNVLLSNIFFFFWSIAWQIFGRFRISTQIACYSLMRIDIIVRALKFSHQDGIFSFFLSMYEEILEKFTVASAHTGAAERRWSTPSREELIHKIISHFHHDATVSLFKFYIKARLGESRRSLFVIYGPRVSCFFQRIRLNMRDIALDQFFITPYSPQYPTPYPFLSSYSKWSFRLSTFFRASTCNPSFSSFWRTNFSISS